MWWPAHRRPGRRHRRPDRAARARRRLRHHPRRCCRATLGGASRRCVCCWSRRSSGRWRSARAPRAACWRRCSSWAARSARCSAAWFLPAATPALWALVGMAAMMGGTMRSPLTAMIFALELTHDIDGLLPLLIGCVAAHAVTVLLMKRSILTEKVARRGHHITREYSVDPFETHARRRHHGAAGRGAAGELDGARRGHLLHRPRRAAPPQELSGHRPRRMRGRHGVARRHAALDAGRGRPDAHARRAVRGPGARDRLWR